MKLITDGEYLGVVLPFMISTLTQPLMGAVNTAVMGQLPDAKYMAAVSLGAILFNNLYWLFGFLRVSTTGYAAQALGAQDNMLGMLAFFKPMIIALVISILCIILQRPAITAYLGMINPAADVATLCIEYYVILIWGAPFVLFNYVALGWLMGQTRIKAAVSLQMSMNILNMLLSWAFVLYWHFEIKGVAWATLISQIYGGVMGGLLMHIYGQFNYKELDYKEILSWKSFVGMLRVNADLMIRTACLLTVNNIVVAVGATFGTVVLAANAVLLQIKDIMSYLIDGMANAAAIFSGKAMGEHSRKLLDEGIKMTYKWLVVLAILLMGSYFVGNGFFIRLFTNITEVVDAAETYKWYVAFYPICAGIGIVLYGVFCGTTYTAPVRDMMIIAVTVFYISQRILVPLFYNGGLWIALLFFMATQSVVLRIYLKKLKHKFDNKINY